MPQPAAQPPQQSETVARILAAAEELFSRRGFDAVSMNDIAEAAGVSKANIFHHFESKNALYLAVVRNACSDSVERLQQLQHEDGAISGQLADFAGNHLKNMLEHDQVSRLILREIVGEEGARRAQELAEKVFGQNFAMLVEIVRTGQRRGELRADLDPAMVATLLIGANVFFFESQEVLRHFKDVDFAREPERYSRMLMDILLAGIRAPKP
ncbi:MAG: TetR/AcrR family transcriptional regulator [Gammaproteobacteria bacterium]|nr:MAG: TetR/AcrR family transcriptional regulator [Gammaproteobacteria bacterium]